MSKDNAKIEEITIAEALRAKWAMEDEFVKLINAFEAKTGLDVMVIHVGHRWQGSEGNRYLQIAHANTEVRFPVARGC